MITVKLMGGLGNQMFQLAFAKHLSIELDQEIIVDASVYSKYKIRPFSSNQLCVFDKINVINLNVDEHLKYRTSQFIYRIYQKVMKSVFKCEKHGSPFFKILSKYGLLYNFDRFYYSLNYNAMLPIDNICIFGYFQSEKYFESSKDIIHESMKVKVLPSSEEKLWIDKINSSQSVAVSMRLGDDYLNLPDFNVCDAEYFNRSIAYFENNLKDPVFYIFSDDIERAKKILGTNSKYQFVYGFEDFQSLRLMYTAHHFILSNSSFSWWGAYLSNNKNKIVICPNKWFNGMNSTPDIFLNSMIKL